MHYKGYLLLRVEFFMRKIIACTLTFFVVFVASGHTPTDSLKVYFTVNQSFFDPALGDNSSSMDSFIGNVRAAMESDNLDYILINGFASPDGPLSLNRRLAEKRCRTIADYIMSHTGLSPEKIKTDSEAVAWNELRKLVAQDSTIPARTRILEILEDVNSPDKRKERLMALDGGRPYRFLLKHLFPKLRYSLAVALYLKSEPESVEIVPEPEEVIVEQPDTVDVVVVSEEVITLPEDTTDIPLEAEATDNPAPEIPRQLFALKTNLLYYGALMPNLELEWLFNDNWSVALEGNVAWWSNNERAKIYCLAVIDGEFRRWIKPRKPWHGFFVGVFAGGGWYDLENGGPGYRGEGLMTGLSAGFMWPVKRNLSFEASVGAGYMYTRYKEYIPLEGHHVYQRTKDLNYFGPLKLKFSIVWRFLDRETAKRIISGI